MTWSATLRARHRGVRKDLFALRRAATIQGLELGEGLVVGGEPATAS